MKKLALALTLACLLGPASTRAQNAYITNWNSNTVSVIDTATNAVSATIPVGPTPMGVAVSPDGSKVYVANELHDVSAIDTATNTVIATIPFGPFPTGARHHPKNLSHGRAISISRRMVVVPPQMDCRWRAMPWRPSMSRPSDAPDPRC